jgi:hypothetical protein
MTRYVLSVRNSSKQVAIQDRLSSTRADILTIVFGKSWTGYASREESEIVKGEE